MHSTITSSWLSIATGLLLLWHNALGHAPSNAGEFVENRGQWDSRARFAVPVAPGSRLFAEQGGFTYALTPGLPAHAAAPPPARQLSETLAAHALHVEFVGSRPVQPLGEQLLPGQRHYLHGNDAHAWASGVQAWQQLRYAGLWPGTDLVLKANDEQQLEYDLLLAPGADPTRLQLRYQGARSLQLDAATGQLRVQTSVGVLREMAPQAWQTDPATGQHQPVACAFRLQGNTVSFALGRYDQRRPLVIDPVVEFASYTDARVENWGFASTYDAAGNLYTAGVVFDPGYPTTVGAYQTSFAGQTDIALMKFNTGVTGPGARVWATYLGGNGLEFPHSLLVNSRNELWLLGTSSSANYPVTSAAVSRTLRGGPAISPADPPFTLPNGSDLVLTRLSADGGRLRASTYLGGSNTDGLLNPAATAPRLRYNFGDAFRGDLTLDPQGNVYVATVSSSPDFPLLATYRGGSSDGLVTSLDSALSRVRWATAVGGQGADAAYSIQRDEASGDLFVAGGTTSPDLVGAAGGYQATLSGDVDGFVARLSSTGALVQSTYLGTSAYDQAYFVRRGPTQLNAVYVLGQTAGAWPNLSGTSFHNVNGRQFIQQLDASLTRPGFATVFGSGRAMPDISPTAFEVDCYGRLFLAGWGGGRNLNGGNTQGLPVTSNALQPQTDGRDFYLMQLSDQAQVLDYASFYGSSADDHVDGGTSRFDAQGILYQALCACVQGSRGIPIPPGAHYYSAINNAPQCNNAALKFAVAANTSGAGVDTLSVCARVGAIRLGGSPAGGTWVGPGVTGSVGAGFYFTPDTMQLGLHVLTYTSPLTGACAGTSTRRITVLAQARAVLRSPIDTFCLQSQGPQPGPVQLTLLPPGGNLTGVGLQISPTTGAMLFDPVLAGPGRHQLVYTVGSGRCASTVSRTLVVRERTRIVSAPPRKMCLKDNPAGLWGQPAGGTWTGTGITGSIAGGFRFDPQLAGVGSFLLTYTVPDSLVCDLPTDTARVLVLPTGKPVRVPADTSMCTTGRPFHLTGGLPAGGSWAGPGVTGTVATGFIYTPQPGMAGVVRLNYTGPVTHPDTCPDTSARNLLLFETRAQVSAPKLVLCWLEPGVPLSANPRGGTWSGPGVSGTVATGYTFTPSPALVGPVRLQYVGPPPSAPGTCPSAAALTLTVVAAPQVYFDSIPAISLCQGLPPHGVQLAAQPPGGTFAGPGVLLNQFNPGVAGIGRHVITYTYVQPGFDCPVTVRRTAVVNDVPTIVLPPDTVLCGFAVPFQLHASPGGGVWSGSGVTPAGRFTPPDVPGTTVLTYALGSGCGSRQYRVTIPAAPTFEAYWVAPGCSTNVVAPRIVHFTATGPAAERVSWDFGDGSAPVVGAQVEHAYATAGLFRPRAELPGAAPGGPCQTDFSLPEVAVEASFLPNIITPNGDPLNEYFAPRVGGCVPHLQVFSRWGQQVFEQAEYHNGWNGAGLPAGLYYYLLTDPGTGRRLKGWVEIMR